MLKIISTQSRDSDTEVVGKTKNMVNIERLQQVRARKQEALDPRIGIVTPEHNLLAGVQAEWMIRLLNAMYFKHGVSSNPDKVKDAIEVGEIRSWFAVRDDEPIAIASLIRNGDGSQELGRAASLDRQHGVGGLLMLMAGLDHFLNNDAPLVAEVRVATQFGGIPNGMATQRNCFDHLGLIPHALIPAFHHGNPDRNELFAFSSSQEIEISEKLFMPGDPAALELLGSIVLPFAGLGWSSKQIGIGGSSHLDNGWEFVEDKPFGLVVPGGLNSSLESTVKRSEEQNSFTLIPIEMSPNMMGTVIGCMNEGFIPCGIDRNLGDKGHPILMLGKLREGAFLAPMQLKEDSIERVIANAMHRVGFEFRKSLKKSI